MIIRGESINRIFVVAVLHIHLCLVIGVLFDGLPVLLVSPVDLGLLARDDVIPTDVLDCHVDVPVLLVITRLSKYVLFGNEHALVQLHCSQVTVGVQHFLQSGDRPEIGIGVKYFVEDLLLLLEQG